MFSPQRLKASKKEVKNRRIVTELRMRASQDTEY